MTAGMLPQRGDRIAGKYLVERVLASGGMGVVLAARHEQLDEPVAIKLLRPELIVFPVMLSRFLLEARASIRIKNPHVVQVFDVGTLDSGLPYMVMEFLSGDDLAAVVQRDAPLPVEKAVDYVLQTCEALAEAHARGIVHRDLKPSNLFVTRQFDGSGWVKVLDFGISKIRAAPDAEIDAAHLTESSVMLGSPSYMSPEQMQSARDVDATTDIWALGVILHEMLAGRRPFEAKVHSELWQKVMHEPPPWIRQQRHDVPAAIERAILGCLERDRRDRWQDVGELARAVAPFGPPGAQVVAEKIVSTLQSAPGVDRAASAAAQTPQDVRPIDPPPNLESRTAPAVVTRLPEGPPAPVNSVARFDNLGANRLVSAGSQASRPTVRVKRLSVAAALAAGALGLILLGTTRFGSTPQRSSGTNLAADVPPSNGPAASPSARAPVSAPAASSTETDGASARASSTSAPRTSGSPFPVARGPSRATSSSPSQVKPAPKRGLAEFPDPD